MNNDRELMQQALEALERYGGVDQRACDAEEALRERLAQPVQEPVAWKDRTYGNLHHQDFGNSIPLYTSPPASKPWVGLSTDEIYNMYNEPRSDAEMVEFARAIEAKLREKNA